MYTLLLSTSGGTNWIEPASALQELRVIYRRMQHVDQQLKEIRVLYMNGFPIGVQKNNKYYLYNHLKFLLKYHSSLVEPHSILQATQADPSQPSGQKAVCEEGAEATLMELDTYNEVIFTYDVAWEYSDIRWVSRWDNYLKMTGDKIHWFAILNSLMIMLFLSGMVAMILLRTLYNELATAEEAAEETGWKLVHGDVFRKPRFGKLLAVSVGSGVQILGMAVVTLIFALLGFLSPAHRGGLLQSMMMLFTFMGVLTSIFSENKQPKSSAVHEVFGGYASARLYKVFNGEDWKTNTLMTAMLYPGVIFVVFFILNLFIWGQKSSGHQLRD
eukprot:symbB.v1.2.012669.t2/scaffold881.1/size155427/8